LCIKINIHDSQNEYALLTKCTQCLNMRWFGVWHRDTITTSRHLGHHLQQRAYFVA